MLLLAAVGWTARPAAADVRLEAGGGVFIPYDDEHRDLFGSSPSFDLAISSAFGENGARVFLEVGHVRASGDEFAPDPTFQLPNRAEYRLWPVTLGVRLDLNQSPDQDLRLYFGLGVRTVFTSAEGADWSGSSPTYGGLLELRPEYLVTDRWSVWIRQRVDVIRDNTYESVRKLDYSAATLELGVSLGLDHAPFTLPRAKP